MDPELRGIMKSGMWVQVLRFGVALDPSVTT